MSPRGNPIIEHQGLIQEVREKFSSIYRDTLNPQFPIRFSKKFRSFCRWGDKRTIFFCNIPNLISQNPNQNFFLASATIIQKSIVSAQIARQGANGSVELFRRLFRDEFTRQVRGSPEIQAIMNFIGTNNQDEAIVSCISASGPVWYHALSHVASLVAYFSGFLGGLTITNPVLGLAAAALLDLACFISGSYRFSKERVQNYSYILYTTWRIILDPNYIQTIRESNLFIAAVDERKLSVILRYNVLTPNDGAWCDFVRIENLECAPTVGSLMDENNVTLQRIHAILEGIRQNPDYGYTANGNSLIQNIIQAGNHGQDQNQNQAQ